MKYPYVIAIDGPAASGKGTLARRLSAHYGLEYLDTGKLYRAVALTLFNSSTAPYSPCAAVEAARTLSPASLSNPQLAEEHIGQIASSIAAITEVRQVLFEFQRNFAANPKGAVMDGRDIGTVICPDADIKFFIHADVHSRAERRYKELQEKGIAVIYDTVLQDLQERDIRDTTRSVAPLSAAGDAIILDTTSMDATEVFETAVSVITKKGLLL